MDDTRGWSISTRTGVSLDADDLIELLAVHHQRLILTWQSFDARQWQHRSRNAEWTVHQTVRHVADGMERVEAAANGHSPRGEGAFDPRSTPAEWLASSENERPSATIDRFATASTSLRTGVADRMGSGDMTHDPTVYGTAHWTVNVAHLLWDSWLHERDVLLPLGLPAPCPEGEQRLVGLYGLLMALVPSMLRGQSISWTVQLSGVGLHTVEVSCHEGALASSEVPAVADAISVAMPAAIDALAGRGDAVADALPGAPEELGFLAAFFNS